MLKSLAFFLALSTALSAQIVDYTFKGHISSQAISDYQWRDLDTLDFGGAFVGGDAFTLVFKLDLDSLDNMAAGGDAFMSAVSHLHFSLDSGAVGTYAGGSMSGSQFLQTHDNLFGSGADTINFYASHNYLISGLSFPDVGAHTFVEFGFNLYSSDNAFVSSTEIGGSLGALLNGPLNLASFDSMHNVQIVFDDYKTFVYGNIESISVDKVPETLPVGTWCALSLLALVTIRRYSSAKT